MAVGKLDLDIEFEDEDEVRRLEEERKKRDEVKEVDLQFSMEPDEGEDAGASGAALKKAQAEARRAALEKKNAAANPKDNVADIGQARQARAVPTQSEPSINFNKPEATAKINHTPARPSASSPHYRLGDELNFAVESNALLNAEVQARVQLAVAEAKTEIIAKAAAEAKLLEHKIVKLLTQAHAKAPAAKAELMAIKKMLAEFADPKSLLEEKSSSAEKTSPTIVAPKKKASGS